MLHVMRKYQQPLMILVTIVIVVSFVVFFTPGSGRKGQYGEARNTFRIYGHAYSQEDLERRARGMRVAMYGGLSELILGLTFGNPYSERAADDFVVNTFVLDHEAQALGVAVSDNEVVAAVEKLSPFQTNGSFDSSKYNAFIDNVLKPSGFTPDRFEGLVRDQLRLRKLVALLGSTAEVTPAEFRAQYIQTFQKIHATVARLDLADFKAAVTPTEDEITKVFKDHEKNYQAPEKRVVSFVKLDLSDADKKQTGKELLDARQNLANRANDFGQDLLKEGAQFADVAKKYGLEVKTTPEFAESAAPEALSSVPQAAAAAFKLTEKEPISDALPMGNGYAVLHLEKVIPSRQLTYEEAKPQVIEQIKTERANSAMVAKGNEGRAKLEEAVKAGKPFAEAAKEAGFKIETPDAFSPAEPPEKAQNGQEILTKSVELADGAISDFTPVASGGLIVHVDKRDPVDEAELKKNEAQRLTSANERKGLITFIQWLESRRRQAQIGA